MRALAVAGLVLLLAGCSAPPAPPPEPTGEELAMLTKLELDQQWQFIGLTPDSPRPATTVERYVTPEEAPDVYRDCMEADGYDNWDSSTGISRLVTNFERLDLYRCVARYPLPPAYFSLYSRAQRIYLYDYYASQLAPCINSAEFANHELPTLDEFLAFEIVPGRSWSPYQLVTSLSPSKRAQLHERCPDLSGSFFTS